MNKKQKDNLLGVGVLWFIVFLGIGLFGLFSAGSFILLFFWGLFLVGCLIIICIIDKHIVGSKPKTCKRNVKIPYLLKWIQNGSFEVFTLDQFYSVYPKQKKNTRLSHIVSGLCSDKKITQIGKNKFRVNGGKL